MVENLCAIEIVDQETVDPEIVKMNCEILNRKIVNLEIGNTRIVKLEIVKSEMVNLGCEGGIRHKSEIDVTSESLRKDLRQGFL